MCKIIRNKAGYEKFTTNMSFDAVIYKTKTHGTSNLQNIEDSSSKFCLVIIFDFSYKIFRHISAICIVIIVDFTSNFSEKTILSAE
jgi:hypothetical protein